MYAHARTYITSIYIHFFSLNKFSPSCSAWPQPLLYCWSFCVIAVRHLPSDHTVLTYCVPYMTFTLLGDETTVTQYVHLVLSCVTSNNVTWIYSCTGKLLRKESFRQIHFSSSSLTSKSIPFQFQLNSSLNLCLPLWWIIIFFNVFLCLTQGNVYYRVRKCFVS